MSLEDDRLVARIIVKNQLATDEQMGECLKEVEESHQGDKPLRLVEVLLRRGIIEKAQAKAVLNAHRKTRRVQALSHNVPGYQFIRDIGHGTAGTVYLATQLSIGRDVAIKVLDDEMASNPGFIRNFQREAKSAARLNHPNVIQAIDVGDAGGFHFFVMEYVDGESLQSVIKREGRLDQARVADIGLQMASALQHASKHGLIHRDVKPANILVNSHGVAKLCDLGLARPVMSTHTTSSGAAGTPAYMSPEQAKGQKDLDIRTDLFSLGSTLYHLVTGEIPFKATNLPDMLDAIINQGFSRPREVRPEISAGVDEAISSLMDKDRDKRLEAPEKLGKLFEKTLGEIPSAPPLFLDGPGGRCAVPPTGQRDSSDFLIPVLTVTGGSQEGDRFPLSWSHAVVGRHSSADVRIRDGWISRQQFCIDRDGDKFKIEVISHSSPTELNGKRIRMAAVEPGDEITIYTTKIKFDLEPPPERE